MRRLHGLVWAFISLSLLPFATFSYGQSVTLSLGSGSGAAGGSVVVPLTLATTGGGQPASVEFSFAYTSDITGVSVVVGPTGTAATKLASCSGATCLIWGMDSTVIGPGSVAVATFQVSSTPSTNTIPIQVTSVVVSDPNGASLQASGVSGSISVAGAPTVSVSTLNCSTTAFYTPGTSTCTVTLSANASSGGFTVPLGSNNSNLTVPQQVVVTAGQSTAQFTATGLQVAASQGATVTAGA
jgi:hypothetical protein